MFGLSTGKARGNEESTVFLDTQITPSKLDLDSLKQALDDILQGKYQSFSCEDEDLYAVLAHFAQQLSQNNEQKLKLSVDLSSQINEAVIAGAEMSRAGKEISDRSNSMAAAVQELTASVEQIADNTSHVAAEANAMRTISNNGMQLSSNASSQMQQIAAQVSETVEKLNSLTTASKEIADVVGFISEIAEQTNLLALNATIEAARAGEAGKGFAVVASEVKQLARKTSENANQIIEKVKTLEQETRDINDTIIAVVESVSKGEKAINSVNSEMESILDVAEKITEQTQNVSSILAEQKEAANEVAQGVNKVADMTEENTHKISSTLDAMDAAEKNLVTQLSDFTGMEIDGLTVNLAKSDHIIWKKRLANMLVGRETLKPEELANHHNCRLGKWYYAIKDPRYIDHPAYKALEDPHAKVHIHGIEAAKKYQDGDLSGAIIEVRHTEEASKEVIRLLNELLKA